MNEENREIGYLAPDGTWYPCDCWCHLDKAVEICALLGEEKTKLDAEKYLYHKCYVILYARHAAFNYCDKNDGKFKLLTPKQKEFLFELEKRTDINDDKLADIKQILQTDNAIRNIPEKELEL